MNSDRATLQDKNSRRSRDRLEAGQAAFGGVDASYFDRARMLAAGKISDRARARESMDRGTEAAELLGRLGMDAETRAAALLFPFVEKGALDVAAIRKSVGIEVARLTQGALRIASLKDLRKTATASLQANRLRQLLLTIAEDPRVVLVSLAHHACALRAAGDAPEQTRHTLAREALEVFAPLANRLGVWEIKQDLEDLAFRYLEPEVYRRIAEGLDQRHADRARYIARVVARLREELRRAGIDAEISGRPKHVYSVWSKMRGKALDIAEVFDVFGFRILVNDVSDCYAALGVVHGLWEPVMDAFDDYIAKPKSNGYQSLHSAVVGPEGVTIEVQIRTFAMHRHADLGVAAHWQYKEGLPKRIAWSRGFLETKESPSRAVDLIDRFKQAAFHDRVYALTPKGHIIDLPAGATPLDFAYAIHTEVGHRCRGAKVDGIMVSLATPLSSGQQVEILTAREAHPSRDWLNPNLRYLKTASARAKVRRWFKQQDHETHVAQGRALLEREHRRLGISEINISEIARRFNMRRPEDLLAALGRGEIGAVRLASALGVESPPPAPSTPLSTPQPPSRAGLLVHGTSHVLTKVAGCCRPVRGEPIGGYVTAQGAGISIHRRDCPNLKRLAALRPHKLVEVTWGG
ncbi:MAG TPA: bifunctional (p)ppGpp synthetase/guanosine-3',5'-bis(diphosphate) 3'-pyrophosphohydrolase [Candidatus Eisenbacteria bacterium]|nr:bifunctional (p)ppGpp synthetase/guanosine-3',5'-bis(diphosphate) 3'-pyrophosphohydrolase [Candidatus Eisenbacteria bacterium]